MAEKEAFNVTPSDFDQHGDESDLERRRNRRNGKNAPHSKTGKKGENKKNRNADTSEEVDVGPADNSHFGTIDELHEPKPSGPYTEKTLDMWGYQHYFTTELDGDILKVELWSGPTDPDEME